MNMDCGGCGYTPGDNEELDRALRQHGYENEFYQFEFGPEKSGTLHLCPVCGEVVSKSEPEGYGFYWDNTPIQDVDEPLDDLTFPPKLQPRDERGTCENCGESIETGDEKIFDTDADGVTHVLCSDSCHRSWHKEFY